jgi:uncharacterized Zn finger protein
MPHIHTAKFKLAEPVRASCDRCGGPRYLIQIKRAELNYDKRIYECAQCGNVITEGITKETRESAHASLTQIE